MQDYSLSFQSFSHSNVLLLIEFIASDDKSICAEYCPKYVKNIADTHIITACEKYRPYLRQYLKSIADTIGSNTNSAILTTLCRLCLVRYQCSGANYAFWTPARTVDIRVIIL